MTRPVVSGQARHITAAVRGFGAPVATVGVPLLAASRPRGAFPPMPLISVATGRYVPGQMDGWCAPPGWKPKPVPPVLCLHGNFGHRDSWFQSGSWPFVKALLDRGLPVVMADGFGAPAVEGHEFANDASQNNYLATVTGAARDIGCHPTKFMVFGTSMGSGTAQALQVNNPTRCIASAHCLVGLSTQAVYDADPATAAYIDEAYSDVGGWAANQQTHDPQAFAENGDLTGLPMWVGDTTDDSGGTSNIDLFCDTVGGTALDGPHYYGTGGHDITRIDPDDPADFLKAQALTV